MGCTPMGCTHPLKPPTSTWHNGLHQMGSTSGRLFLKFQNGARRTGTPEHTAHTPHTPHTTTPTTRRSLQLEGKSPSWTSVTVTFALVDPSAPACCQARRIFAEECDCTRGADYYLRRPMGVVRPPWPVGHERLREERKHSLWCTPMGWTSRRLLLCRRNVRPCGLIFGRTVQ